MAQNHGQKWSISLGKAFSLHLFMWDLQRWSISEMAILHKNSYEGIDEDFLLRSALENGSWLRKPTANTQL